MTAFLRQCAVWCVLGVLLVLDPIVRGAYWLRRLIWKEPRRWS